MNDNKDYNMNQTQFEDLQLHINNVMTIFPPGFDTHTRFLYFFLLHVAAPGNKFQWQPSFYKAVLNFTDTRLEKCKKILLTFGFIEQKSVYCKVEKKEKTYYEMHYLKNL